MEEMACSGVRGPVVSLLKNTLQQQLKGVVGEMKKTFGSFDTRWMIDLIHNIVKECCIQDELRKVPWCMCTMGKVTHFCVVQSY